MNNDNWLELGEELFRLEHKHFLSELPDDFIAPSHNPTLKPLKLSALEKSELLFRIFQVKRQILIEAKRFHIEKFNVVPKWIIDGLNKRMII